MLDDILKSTKLKCCMRKYLLKPLALTAIVFSPFHIIGSTNCFKEASDSIKAVLISAKEGNPVAK